MAIPGPCFEVISQSFATRRSTRRLKVGTGHWNSWMFHVLSTTILALIRCWVSLSSFSFHRQVSSDLSVCSCTVRRGIPSSEDYFAMVEEGPSHLTTGARSQLPTWKFPEMGVAPNHPFSVGIFYYNPSIWGTPILWKSPRGISPKSVLHWFISSRQGRQGMHLRRRSCGPRISATPSSPRDPQALGTQRFLAIFP